MVITLAIRPELEKRESVYLEIIYQLLLYPSLYPDLRSCILLRSHAEGGYKTKGQDARIDTEIIGE